MVEAKFNDKPLACMLCFLNTGHVIYKYSTVCREVFFSNFILFTCISTHG